MEETDVQSRSPVFCSGLFSSKKEIAERLCMQDAFWWWFCEEYQPEKGEDQKQLFNRLAERFVNIFLAGEYSIKHGLLRETFELVFLALATFVRDP